MIFRNHLQKSLRFKKSFDGLTYRVPTGKVGLTYRVPTGKVVCTGNLGGVYNGVSDWLYRGNL